MGFYYTEKAGKWKAMNKDLVNGSAHAVEVY